MSDDVENRITELESIIAHQEQAINDLSDVLKSQWEEIEKLRREIFRLEDIKADRPPEEDNQPPPHY